MGENTEKMFSTADYDNDVTHDHWTIKEENDDIKLTKPTTPCFEDSTSSIGSTSSSDLLDSASSSLPNGPLYELSELMTQLPIRRGLSKYFRGKSQSFTCLSNVRCIEDLAKGGIPFRKRMKSCKSYGGSSLDAHKLSYTPKAIISKKTTRGSFPPLLSKRSSFRPPPTV